MANENYTTDFIYRLYSEEGKDIFTTRMNILGHMQQGGSPSPFDRNFGTKFAAKAADWLLSQLKLHTQPDCSVVCSTPETAVLLGLVRRQYRFTPIQKLKRETDFKYVLIFFLLPTHCAHCFYFVFLLFSILN